MAIDTGLIGACPDLLLSGMEVWGVNAPEKATTRVGVLEILTSEANATELDVQYFNEDGGHLKGARVQYKDRLTSNDVINAKSCDNGVAKNRKVANIEIDIFKGVKIGISRDKLRAYCEEASRIQSGVNFPQTPVAPIMGETMREIMGAMNAIRTSLNTSIVGKIASAFGKTVGGSTSAKSVQLLNADGSPSWVGVNEILFDMVNAEVSGTPLIAGFGKFHKFNTVVTLAGGLQDSGIDFAKGNGTYSYAPDLTVPSALGNADDFIAFAPQSNHVLFFNENKGTFAGNHGSVSYGLLPDPYINGLNYDVKVKYDDCDDLYTIDLSINAGFFNVPNDAFSSYDRLNGVNGLFRYRATQGA
jgi:hypothetical protein